MKVFLMHTPHTVDEFNETFRRVVQITHRMAPRADYESLALEIIEESWSKDVTFPPAAFVRKRCIDELRRAKSADTAYRRTFQCRRLVEPSPLPEIETREQVDTLILQLTPTERKLIHARFYLDKTIAEIAKDFRLDPTFVSQSISAALYKMREMGK